MRIFARIIAVPLVLAWLWTLNNSFVLYPPTTVRAIPHLYQEIVALPIAVEHQHAKKSILDHLSATSRSARNQLADQILAYRLLLIAITLALAYIVIADRRLGRPAAAPAKTNPEPGTGTTV
jgi:hypothetical protein